MTPESPTETIHRVLGLDLGHSCGWAMLVVGQGSGGMVLRDFGHLNLAPRKYESQGITLMRFKVVLTEIAKDTAPTVVAYEDVRRHLGTAAAHAYGALRGQLLVWCEENKIPATGLGTGVWKKAIGIAGNASKSVIRSAVWDQFVTRDHPLADECQDVYDAVGIAWGFASVEVWR
jgi:Holliday junction resolvasome RuvABC endonuclease subunit